MQITDKPKPSRMMSFRLPTKHINLLTHLADTTGLSKSELLRKGIEQLATQDTPSKESFFTNKNRG